MPPAVRNAGAEQLRCREQDFTAVPSTEQHGLRPLSPSNQSQEDSEWVYGSATETTDSAHAWVADALDEPPEGTGHPILSRIKSAVLRVFLFKFHAWQERNPSPASKAAGSSAQRENARPRKRGRLQPDRGGVPDEDGDDDDEMEDAGGRKRQRPDEGSVNKLTLACPFFKKDRRLNGSCCGKKLTRIRDVKQHLQRRHYMPIYCPICKQTFSDETARDDHTREISCQRGAHPRPEGINQRQQVELRKRASRQLTEEQQWFDIFTLLFPNEPPPPTAYIDASLFASAMSYQDFVTTRGLEILRSVLAASDAIHWNVPVDQDLETFQRQILGEGLAVISDEWAREGAPSSAPGGGLAASERSRARVEASSEGGSLEVVNAGSTSHHPDTAIDSSMTSPGSALQAGALSSIPDSSNYTHSHSGTWWSYGEHQDDLFPTFPDLNVEETLGEEEMGEIRRIISEADTLNWQHGVHEDYMRR